MLEGIDVSRWQGSTPSLAGLSFLIAKATEGTWPDPMFAKHIANARAAGLVVGAYHFARDDVALPDQVDAFLAATADVPWLAFDVEGRHAWSLAALRQAVKRVHDAGRQVGVYMSDSAYLEAGQDWRWVARWSPTAPTRHWDLWQYRGSPADLDRFDGTLDELRELAGQEAQMVPLPITDQTPKLITVSDPATFYRQDGSVESEGHHLGATIFTSPYQASKGTSTFRAIYAGPAPVRLILVKPATISPVPADCSAQVASAITADRASARIVYPG